MQPRVVGLLVIGDELMKGKIADGNIRTACNEFFRSGAQVKRVVMVGDNSEDICRELYLLCRQCDLVITSGGVGPTHDDITMETIATAVGRTLVVDGQMREILENLMRSKSINRTANIGIQDSGPILNDAQLKMCHVPEGASITPDEKTYPLVNIGKIFVLPGVPDFFRKKLDMILAKYFSSTSGARSAIVRFQAHEHQLAEALNLVVAGYPLVVFGSYPR